MKIFNKKSKSANIKKSSKKHSLPVRLVIKILSLLILLVLTIGYAAWIGIQLAILIPVNHVLDKMVKKALADDPYLSSKI